jgi:uncharacterized membrane protein YfcA
VLLVCCAIGATAEPAAGSPPGTAWWTWVVLLFLMSLAIGFFAVLAGIGGGVVFVPLLAGFFPFHMDFVRGAGSLVALATALSASSRLADGSLVRLRLALPCSLIASVFAIIGVRIGFVLPVDTMQLILGVLILIATGAMAFSGKCERPEVPHMDWLARRFGLEGRFLDESSGQVHPWRVHRTIPGLAAFSVIGLIAGMFGIGSGWASVPMLNLVMGVPLKMAVATSLVFLLPGTTAAAWGYLNHGAVLPILVAPSLLGVMLGSRLGALVLPKVKTEHIRHVVVAVLMLCGLRALLKGTGLWI